MKFKLPKVEPLCSISFYIFLLALFSGLINPYIGLGLLIISLILAIGATLVVARNIRAGTSPVPTLFISFRQLNALDWMQLSFLGAILLSAVFAVHKLDSLTMGSVFVGYLIIYFVAKFLINDHKSRMKFIYGVGIIVTITSIIGIIQYFTKFSYKIGGIPIVFPMNGGRITSILPNTIIVASLIGFVFPTFILMIISKHNPIFWSIVLIISLSAFIMSKSIGPFIALILSIIIYCIIAKKKIIYVILILIICGFCVYKPVRERWVAKFSELYHLKSCLRRQGCLGRQGSLRAISIITGLRMWKANNIWTGVGTYGFYRLYKDYAPPKAPKDLEKKLEFIHCSYLSILVENGIIGVITFILMIAMLLKYSLANEKYRIIGQSIFISFLCLLVMSLVDKTIYVVRIAGIFWSYMGVVSRMWDELTY